MADLPPLPAGATVIAATPPPLPAAATPIATDHPPLPKGAQPAPQDGSGIMSRIEDAAMSVPKAQLAGAKEIVNATTRRGSRSYQDIKGDLTSPVQGKPKQGVGAYVSKDIRSKGSEKPGIADYAARGLKTGMDVTNVPFNLAAGPIEATAGRVSEELGGPKKETVGDAGAMLTPFGGELKALGKMGAEAVGGLAKKALGTEMPRTVNSAETLGKEPKTPSNTPNGARHEFPSGTPPLPKGAMPVEGPLSQPPALTQPRKFEDQLFQLEENRVADKVDVLKAVKAAPDVPAETWEKLYHHEENPEGVKLTPEEQQVYDQHVAPITAESNKLYKELEGITGEKLEDNPTAKGYTPRYVAGKTRSFGEILDRWKKGVETKFQGGAAARSMRQTVDAQKSRRFYNAVSPDGEKIVVHIGKDGKVSAFDGSDDPAGPEFGQFPKGQKIGPGSKLRAEGNTWRLENATTKEIENVASTRYHKNVLANRLDNLAKLRSAVRNAKFIRDVKASPDWGSVAMKKDAVLDPPKTNGREWRTPKTPQFGQYYMEPTLADALDDAAGRTHDLDGISSGLDKMGNLVKGSIFWNPIPHIRNVANHYFVDKGLVGGLASVGKGAATLAKGGMPATLRAARAVMTQNEEYMRALRAGGSLPYARYLTSDLHKALTTKLGEAVTQDPKQWDTIAKIGGYANPVEMIKRVYKASNAMLWGASDIMTVARYMDRMEKGLPLEKAIHDTETHMPNYRVPGQVMGTRLMSQLLTSPVATMFGRYQYNRLASYMHMARDMVSSESSIKDKAEALDKLAALGVMLTLYYPAMDKAWQKITGNENAKASRPGAASVPQAAYDVGTGAKTPDQGAESVFSPGIIEAPIEAFHGRYLYSGQPIAYPENLTDGHPDQFARDIGSWIGSKISPVGQAQSLVGGAKTPEQFLLSQIGVSTPSDEQVANKNKYANKDAKYAAKRAVKKENQRQ